MKSMNLPVQVLVGGVLLAIVGCGSADDEAAGPDIASSAEENRSTSPDSSETETGNLAPKSGEIGSMQTAPSES